jgi:hypothetical protein
MKQGDRAWPTRGLASPPFFGRSLPEGWAPSTVTFLRSAIEDDGHGGFTTNAAPGPLLTSPAHVYWGQSGEPSGPYDLGIGIVTRKVIRAIIPVPADPAQYPRRGDEMVWTDDLGATYRAGVRNVHSPSGILDHIEVESEGVR